MNDLISRAEAIELKPEFLNPNVNRETKEQTAIDRAYARGWNSCNTHWIKEIIEDLPSAQPDQDREFIKLTVRNSNGRPYYSIIYLEVDDNGVGRDFEGYSSYSLDVISDYLKKYFMPSALPETCEGCKHLGKWENEFEYGYPSPCTRCKRRVEDHYER